MPPAPSGNASNPSAEGGMQDVGGPDQLLDPKAEKYLREVSSIEDLPDEQDWQDAEEEIKKEKEEGA